MDELYDEIGKWRKKGGIFRTVVGIAGQTLVVIGQVGQAAQELKTDPLICELIAKNKEIKMKTKELEIEMLEKEADREEIRRRSELGGS